MPVFKFAENSHHIGSIVGGDFNQALKVDDHDSGSLHSCTTEVGLTSIMSAYLAAHGVLPYNTYHCMQAKGGGLIDNIFTSLPFSLWRGAGSPSDVALNSVSDHLPIQLACNFQEAGMGSRVKFAAAPTLTVLDVSTPEKRAKMQSAMRDAFLKLRHGFSFHCSGTTTV